MVLARTFDLKAVALQRTGRLGTYAVSLGQEAVSVGVASAMREEDVLLPSYRENPALLWRGVKIEEILLFWGGDERGNYFSGTSEDFPFCIPVGSQAPHAARCARSSSLLCCFPRSSSRRDARRSRGGPRDRSWTTRASPRA